MNAQAPRQRTIVWRGGFRSFREHSRRLALLALALLISGCSMIPGLPGQPTPAAVDGTAVALQITVLAATLGAPGQQPTVAPPTAAPPTLPVEPQPTYTLQPTYTPQPTFTPQPTYTPYPTFTQPAAPAPVFEPTQTPLGGASGAGRPFTLRVRNMHRTTHWIGAKMPYGGNFIDPRWYVEFYPPEEMWMRVWVCQYTRYFYEHWDDSEWVYYFDYWKHPDRVRRNWDDDEFWRSHEQLFNCYFRDVYVDEALVEINVP